MRRVEEEMGAAARPPWPAPDLRGLPHPSLSLPQPTTPPPSLSRRSFEWVYWKQAEEPWDDRELRYIAALDAEADLAKLHEHGVELRPECERVFKVCTMVLRRLALAGWTAARIGAVMSRESSWSQSTLEKARGARGSPGRAHAAAG